MQTIDVVTQIQPGADLAQLAFLLACIGDFADLLNQYAGCDATTQWKAAIAKISEQNDITTPQKALNQLALYLEYEVKDMGKKRKRKLAQMEHRKFTYVFDYERFKREHPHPMDIENHGVSSQLINQRFLQYEELDMEKRIILLHSEMGSG